MAVVIRLARFGSTHEPKYRITVADSRRFVKGKYLEVIGHYNPNPRGKDERVVIDLQKADEWIKKGAQPSDRVKSVMRLAQSKTAAAKA